MIVPLARLFKITTDELFEFNESLEDIRKAELKNQYDDTFKTGDIKVRLAITEKAVKAYPGDMDWLNKYGWATWCDAFSISNDEEYNSQREKATGLFQKVIENCKIEEIKCNAIVGIVQCLSGKDNAKAKHYAELYPDVKINANEKEKLILSCLEGEELIVKQQERLLRQVETLTQDMVREYYSSQQANITAKAIIKLFIPDGNYQTFHYQLYMIDLSEARAEISAGDYDKAMISMQSARKHAIAFDSIKGDYSFTAPFFDHIKYNTENWCITGNTKMLEDFRTLFDFDIYKPLKSHKDYAELIK